MALCSWYSSNFFSRHIPKRIKNIHKFISSMADRSSFVAVCQMTSTNDKEKNFEQSRHLILEAKRKGAVMAFLPECFDYIGKSKDESVSLAEPLDGNTIKKYRQLAIRCRIWLSLGGFHEKGPEWDSQRVYNTHIIVNNRGEIQALYRKLHLFDVHIPGLVKLTESDYTIPGDQIVNPVDTPAGNVGLMTCYDLRFPEQSALLAMAGSKILTYPSTFTVPTGMAHWESLLRSRAIETQCYVVAAAQSGSHNETRKSYGHSMVVDPWGTVVAACSEGPGLALAELNLDYLQKIRREMPVFDHRRRNVYNLVPVTRQDEDESTEGVDDLGSYDEYGADSKDGGESGETSGAGEAEIVETPKSGPPTHYKFGIHTINASIVFLATRLSIAFVNRQPVVPGHVLVAPRRCIRRLTDLTSEECADLFLTAQRVSGLVQKVYVADASTLAVQDGKAAGQTVEHVHAHVMPRKPGDFSNNDDVYKELERHGRRHDASRWRTQEEMDEEAARLARSL